MKVSKVEAVLVAQIKSYCEQIRRTSDYFGNDREAFTDNNIYRNAILYCFLQIGELVEDLDEGIKLRHKEIPWRGLRTMRNLEMYRLKMMEDDDIWSTIHNEVPALERVCCEELGEAF